MEIGQHLLKLIGVSFGCGGMTLSQLQMQGSLLIMFTGLLIAMIPVPKWFTKQRNRNAVSYMVVEGIILIGLSVLSILTIVSETFNSFIYFRF